MTTHPMPAPLTQRERNRLRTRNDILDAAAQLLSEDGYAGTALEKIGRVAGLARGTIYAHFPSGREEIVRCAYLRQAEAVIQRGKALRADVHGAPERIAALARALTEASADPRGRFYGVMGPDLATVLAGVTGSASRSFENFIRDDLAAARTAGGLGPTADIEALTIALSGALRASGARAAADPGCIEAQVEAIRLLVRGLLSAHQTSTEETSPERSTP